VPADAVRLGKRLDGFSVSATGVSLGFADGEQAEADVLIGADGIHSVIRAALTEPAPPAHSGHRTAWPGSSGRQRAAASRRLTSFGTVLDGGDRPGHELRRYGSGVFRKTNNRSSEQDDMCPRGARAFRGRGTARGQAGG
jgi:hypothetical protein